MTIQDLRDQKLILFECITGSKAYGLALPHSDTDIKGVFILPKENYYALDYIPQVNDATNDTVFYELGRFIELLSKNNPNLLEMLNVAEEHIIYKHPIFDQIKPELFLSQEAAETFVNYARSQIKKARGLNKKIVNPVEPERKTVLNFCYITHGQGSIPLLKWLEIKGYKAENCGLVNIAHIKDLYALFYDAKGDLGYKGIISQAESNQVLLSSIPKEEEPIAYLHFSKDSYAQHCKEYRQYWEWVDQRNEERYQNTLSHGKSYDSKNMMHTFRLLGMAEDLLSTGKIIVQRPNREELLAIRAGKFEYEELLELAEDKIEAILKMKNASVLPQKPDLKKIEQLLVELRMELYDKF
jgi:acetone carboxylase gamma subunit